MEEEVTYSRLLVSKSQRQARDLNIQCPAQLGILAAVPSPFICSIPPGPLPLHRAALSA